MLAETISSREISKIIGFLMARRAVNLKILHPKRSRKAAAARHFAETTAFIVLYIFDSAARRLTRCSDVFISVMLSRAIEGNSAKPRNHGDLWQKPAKCRRERKRAKASGAIRNLPCGAGRRAGRNCDAVMVAFWLIGWRHIDTYFRRAFS